MTFAHQAHSALLAPSILKTISHELLHGGAKLLQGGGFELESRIMYDALCTAEVIPKPSGYRPAAEGSTAHKVGSTHVGGYQVIVALRWHER